jgi:hypothetical protein
VNWERDVVRPLKKGLAFLRRHPNKFERERLDLDTLCEAIVSFNTPNDSLYQKAKRYREARDIQVDIWPSYAEPWITAENLLSGLRALASHGRGVGLDEDDAKIALYLALRLFHEPQELNSVAERIFDGSDALPGSIPASRDKTFFKRIDGLILEELGVESNGAPKSFRNEIIWRKGDEVFIDRRTNDPKRKGGAKLDHFRIGEARRSLNGTDPDSAIFNALNHKKHNHYLLFLSRLSRLPTPSDGDLFLVQRIAHKVGLEPLD